MKKQTVSKLLFLGVLAVFLVSFVSCQEEAATTAATTGKEEEEEEEPAKKSCSIWCWIQKIAMFVISQLLSGQNDGNKVVLKFKCSYYIVVLNFRPKGKV